MTGSGSRYQGGGELVIVGAGGFGRETAQAVHAANDHGATWRLLGYLDDDPARHGSSVEGIPILGGRGEIEHVPDASVVVCTGRPSDYTSRPRIVTELNLPPERYATIVHPAAAVSASSSIGPGCVPRPLVRRAGISVSRPVRVHEGRQRHEGNGPARLPTPPARERLG